MLSSLHGTRLSLRVIALASIALLCFAANSLLCRQALGSRLIDPALFTAIRLTSGSLLLLIIVFVSGGKPSSSRSGKSWLAAAMLFVYAAAFSFAYINLTAGTGALILFGCVQATMIAAAIAGKEVPTLAEWAGLLLALAGLVYLVLPSLESPPLESALLMATAGVAWGVYSLLGRGVKLPIEATAGNFMRSVPFALALLAVFFSAVHYTAKGVGLAGASGAITSGLGYVVWYAVVPLLGATRAAVAQLLVPVIAAIGGVLLLGEHLSSRLLIAGAVILSGVCLALFLRRPSP